VENQDESLEMWVMSRQKPSDNHLSAVILDGWLLDDIEGPTIDLQQGSARRQGTSVRYSRQHFCFVEDR
jgi:hypothetical protein